jgi:DNA-binding transcriptional ArsR family regulator
MEEGFLKLTNAVYRVLEYFPESDPLKNRAKNKVLSIMSAIGGSASGGDNSIIQEDIALLLNYLKVGKSQGWLSCINYLIISNEYEKISQKLKQPANVRPKERPESVLDKSMVTDRQQKILKFLEEKERAQVMDLQTILPDVTKRTIRRDLDELLEIGKIARLGKFNQIFYKIA